MEVLICQNCQKWMDSGCVHSCMCALVCGECASKANRCKKCGHDHKVKARVTSLHKRLAAVIPHFCSNKECFDLVVPGDDHETNCKYVPLKCPWCPESFQNDKISHHFASQHPHQVLLKHVNSNVLRSKFFEIPGLELPTLLCCAQGQYLSITILKFEDKDPNVDFLIKNIKTSDDVNVAVKLIFKLNEYSHAQRNYKNQRVPIISIAKDKFYEWWSGSSTLEIKIVIRKKRNYNNGKRKRVTN